MRVSEQIIILGGLGGDPLAPAAPTLAWITAPSVSTPGFNIDFDDSVVAGDVVTVQYASNPAFISPSQTTHAITAPEIASGQINLSIGALANGTYYVRANITHGVHVSAWSNTVTITISAALGSTPTYYFLGF